MPTMTVTEGPPAEIDLTREEGRWTHQWAELVLEVERAVAALAVLVADHVVGA